MNGQLLYTTKHWLIALALLTTLWAAPEVFAEVDAGAKPFNFWNFHGVWFIIGMITFPRITMFFFATMAWGPLCILGFIFVPYLTAAIIATNLYWDSNTVLCVFAWLVALSGTFGEGRTAQQCI